MNPGLLRSAAEHATLTIAARSQTSPFEVAAKTDDAFTAKARAQKAAHQYTIRTGHIIG